MIRKYEEWLIFTGFELLRQLPESKNSQELLLARHTHQNSKAKHISLLLAGQGIVVNFIMPIWNKTITCHKNLSSHHSSL